MLKALGAIGITAWLGWSVKRFVDMTNPPICRVGEECLQPAAPIGTPYRLATFLSESLPTSLGVSADGIPWPKTPTGDVKYAGLFETAVGHESLCGETVVEVKDPSATALHEEAKRSFVRKLLAPGKQCLSAIDFEFPVTWRSNKTNIYLTAVAVDPSKTVTVSLFRPTINPITILYAPDKKLRAHKRLLLSQKIDDLDVIEAAQLAREKEKPTVSIPKRVRIGPIELGSEESGASSAALRNFGLRHWINKKKYHPDLYLDTLVSPRDEYQSLVWTDSDEPITVRIELSPVSWRKQALHRIFQHSTETMEQTFGMSRYDTDSFKLLLAGESPVILLVTFIVSGLHMVFEFLALSSNVSHFNETTKDASRSERVSRRAVMIDTVLEVFILAWLRDEGEAVLVQLLLGTKIAFNLWRYFKLASMQKIADTESVENKAKPITASSWQDAFSIEKLRARRQTESAERFEQGCLVALSKLMIPVALAFGWYQLVYVPQKGWISWAIKSCAMSSYVGGFVAMTPQLYKNFYFRSVEHLPWTTLTYQFLNTIIDDLFSFLIRMPKAHRVSVFRDDIIFVIYWIQKRHYKAVKAKVEEGDSVVDGASERMEVTDTNTALRNRAHKPRKISSADIAHSRGGQKK